jgi:hypothetical protein
MKNAAGFYNVVLLNAFVVSLVLLPGKPITQLTQTEGTMCAYADRDEPPRQTRIEAGTKCCKIYEYEYYKLLLPSRPS